MRWMKWPDGDDIDDRGYAHMFFWIFIAVCITPFSRGWDSSKGGQNWRWQPDAFSSSMKDTSGTKP